MLMPSVAVRWQVKNPEHVGVCLAEPTVVLKKRIKVRPFNCHLVGGYDIHISTYICANFLHVQE